MNRCRCRVAALLGRNVVRLFARRCSARLHALDHRTCFCCGTGGPLIANSSPRRPLLFTAKMAASTSVSASTSAACKKNRLANEKSPYLLQHASNPVDWFPWGKDAFAKAKAEDKLIFLSVGYSTCHWCHVMERESFESEEIAKIMNEHFVNVKVDREERPDIDRVYMTYIQATSGGGGWPMSVWLTPDLKPVVGGTYFPPEDRYYGQPGFKTLLTSIAEQVCATSQHVAEVDMFSSQPLAWWIHAIEIYSSAGNINYLWFYAGSHFMQGRPLSDSGKPEFRNHC